MSLHTLALNCSWFIKSERSYFFATYNSPPFLVNMCLRTEGKVVKCYLRWNVALWNIDWSAMLFFYKSIVSIFCAFIIKTLEDRLSYRQKRTCRVFQRAKISKNKSSVFAWTKQNKIDKIDVTKICIQFFFEDLLSEINS